VAFSSVASAPVDGRRDPVALGPHIASDSGVGKVVLAAATIVDFFDAVAAEYDGWAGGVHRRVAARLVELASPQTGERCLDTGSGTGLVATSLARSVGPSGAVVGVDASVNMVRQALEARAREGLENLVYRRMRVDDVLPFADGLFDLVTFGNSLAYLRDPLAVLREARRVLGDDGRLALSVRRRSLVTPLQETFFGWLEELSEQHWLSVPRPETSRAPLGEPKVVSSLLRDAGFAEPRTTTMVTGSQMPSAAAWIDRMAGLGPWPWTMVRTLGRVARRRLEAALESEMQRLGDERFHYTDAFTFAVARAGRPPQPQQAVCEPRDHEALARRGGGPQVAGERSLATGEMPDVAAGRRGAARRSGLELVSSR
jgi:ubiquinone/menaquinone biosynthesis C-methylase UbiE